MRHGQAGIRKAFAVVTGAVLLLAAAASPASAFRDPGDDHGHLLSQLDVRDDARQMKRLPAAAAAAAEARAELRATLGPQGWLDLDPLTGTPRSVAKLDGFLTGESDAPAQEVALGWVRDHAEVFGLDEEEIDALSLTRNYVDWSGTTHLIWSQSVSNIPVFEHGLMANVNKDGRLINVLGSPVPEPALRSVAPRLTAGAALKEALANAHAPLVAPRILSVVGADRVTRFTGGHDARLVIFNEGPGALRLAWRVTANANSVELYDYLVDAGTGRILLRDNLVEFFTQGKAWEYFPGTACAQPPSDACPYLDGQTANTHNFSSKGWIANDGRLRGDNTHTYFDLQDNIDGFANDTAPAGAEVPASGGHFNYAFTQINTDWSCSVDIPCSWNPSAPNSWQTNANQNATQIFYYVNLFHDHIKQAPYGFDEASGNFENDNGGAGGAGGDAVQAQVLDGANTAGGLPDGNHTNNANMATRADGTPPTMQMYLMDDFADKRFFDANSGDDASVIYHEYVHGVSSRLVLDSTGTPSLRSHQSGAMGEAWSDFYALDYLVEKGFDKDLETPDPSSGNLPYRDMVIGYYVTGGDPDGIRPQPLDCRVADTSHPRCGQSGTSGPGGFTYGDLVKIAGQPSVHWDGNIWSQILWEIRQTISAGGANATNLARARAIITNGMRLSVANPSFVDMRNGIIQAEQAAGGQHLATLWNIFARRGLGYFAASRGGNDLAPKESFAPPTSGSSTLTGRITETETSAPVAGATVELLGPGNLAATTDSNGVYTIQNVAPGSYPYLTAVAPGHEPQLMENVSVGSGNATLDLQLHRDWAAVHGGSGTAEVGTIVGPNFTDQGCGPIHALDTVQGTGWGTTSPAPQDPAYAAAVGPKSFVVKLPQEVDVSSFAVDPTAICGDDATASLGGYKIETSTDGVVYTQAHVGTFSSSSNGKYNVLIPTAGAKRVRYVRMTMNQPQGGSGESFKNFMDMTELMVFGKPSPPPDSDGDGVADPQDACPTKAGPLAGCPDADGDGVADASDGCPGQEGTLPNGCSPPPPPPPPPPSDSDGDGVPDGSDGCPTQAGTAANGGCAQLRPADGGGALVKPAISKTSWKRLLKKGLTVKVGCTVACRLTAALSIDGTLARKVKLTRSKRAKQVTVGAQRAALPAGGTNTLRIQLSPKAKKAFKKYRRRLPRTVPLAVKVTGATTTGVKLAPLTSGLKLKR